MMIVIVTAVLLALHKLAALVSAVLSQSIYLCLSTKPTRVAKLQTAAEQKTVHCSQPVTLRLAE